MKEAREVVEVLKAGESLEVLGAGGVIEVLGAGGVIEVGREVSGSWVCTGSSAIGSREVVEARGG